MREDVEESNGENIHRGVGIFPLSSILNHSHSSFNSHPNCIPYSHFTSHTTPQYIYRACRRIRKGEEIKYSYIDQYQGEEEKREQLFKTYRITWIDCEEESRKRRRREIVIQFHHTIHLFLWRSVNLWYSLPSTLLNLISSLQPVISPSPFSPPSHLTPTSCHTTLISLLTSHASKLHPLHRVRFIALNTHSLLLYCQLSGDYNCEDEDEKVEGDVSLCEEELSCEGVLICLTMMKMMKRVGCGDEMGIEMATILHHLSFFVHHLPISSPFEKMREYLCDVVEREDEGVWNVKWMCGDDVLWDLEGDDGDHCMILSLMRVVLSSPISSLSSLSYFINDQAVDMLCHWRGRRVLYDSKMEGNDSFHLQFIS